MSETSRSTVAEKWKVLHAVLPVFYSASLEPIDGGVNHGDSGAMGDVDSVHLQHSITALRTDLKLNMLRQGHIGTQWLIRSDIDLESLAGGLQMLFEVMENLFNEDFYAWPRYEVHIASADGNPNLRKYPRLMLLWETLQMHEIGHRGTNDQSYVTWRQRYSLDSVRELSRLKSFPRDYERLKMLRKNFSHFRLEMDNITGQRIPRYRPEVRINPFTTLDAQTIQQAHGIAAACESLFIQIAASNAYGNHHGAKLHLPGFKMDQLKLDISTFQGTDMVPAVFTRSFDRPPNVTFDPGDIFFLESSNLKRSGILHFAFNEDFIWIQNAGGEVPSPSSSVGEETLDLHLGNLYTFPPMHRRMTSVLFAASMFQLSDTPWIDPRLDLARAFLPMPIDEDLQQWYPRIYCNLELGQTTSPQSDNIAALGVLLMQLEAARKSEWLPDADEDWLTGQRSNQISACVNVNDFAIHYGIEQRPINYEKSKTFVHPNEKGADNWRKDTCGHGTHVTELLLETAPAAEIFVGKISTDKVINQEYMPGIAEAITWAANECDADIISLSFGYEDHDELIEQALKNAISKGKLIVAAASNNGGLKGRSRPARREGVLCIHATDGKGNSGDMNPSSLERGDNFATLGVSVCFYNAQGDLWKSGTSFATPIAVGFAAAVLEFARYRETIGFPIKRGNLLREKRGMEAVFRGLNNVVPIPDEQRYYDMTSDTLADVQHSRDGQGGLLVSALDGIIGGNASLHRGRHDGDVYRIDNVETTHFYPEDDYYEKCLQLHQVERFNKKFKYKKPIYLITGLKVAHRASITMGSGRQTGGNTEANVQVPTVPVDLEVGAQAGASSSSEVVSSFTKPDAFILAIQVRKIYHKRAFLSGETKLVTETVVKGAVLVDDDDIEDKDDEAEVVGYELHDLDEEDLKGLTLLKGEDGDEA
ncbi:uncharacterized protein FTJAE_2307 [Fusarium tjaetaba]|uniref:Peptidase S8/S53 domain-containing protein n=1 Tax=Fusarium tjaetaba TaxID=1567544 RepID=A0A8H5S7Z6_9HYPO|nr:uncharacterized protein FTJAE_2307 [Fusarium tjaetaba]KAF5645877.1 hypothetical protein FTJAE_2307 [Fusarium tjaetaba]